MTVEAAIATVTDYDSLIEAFRTIKDRRGLSFAMVDDLAGLTRGHSEKILGQSQTKGLSPIMLQTFLDIFAVKLVMVVDEDAEQRMAGRWERRDEGRVRVDAHRVSKKLMERARPLVFKEMSAKAALARKNIPPEKRSAIARRAAKARHRKRRREIKSPPLVPAD